MQTATLSDTQLTLAHDDANRWLNLPGADLWPQMKADMEAQLRETWGELQRRRAAKTDRKAA